VKSQAAENSDIRRQLKPYIVAAKVFKFLKPKWSIWRT